MTEYVTKCHANCIVNSSKEPNSILEYYFLSEKDALCELSDSECVRRWLNFAWGAMDTTRATICFAVLESIKNPEHLHKLQAELDQR